MLQRETLWACTFLAVGALAAAQPTTAPPVQPERRWQVVKTEQLPGLKVSLSAPVLVARSKSYLWFPTLVRMDNGDLLAVMSNYADVHTTSSTGVAAWSGDGGLTWSAPREALYSESHLRLP